MDGTDLKKY